MTFSMALNALNSGQKISRMGWNGNNQYVQLAFMQECILSDGTVIQDPEHLDSGSRFLMFAGNRGYQCGWLASQSDMLAEDWRVI